ncbi:hypothetical protein IW18_01200 [Flavobacterium hibernum]|uniref:Uncharacterized protein n=1 Tax=Flavobacterium hibernum TaxID=37752 RepID=A0A0D0F4Q5_9FLAO|nr:hypothetical protein IW18_01200 [Flavobacterium hibernum]
MLDPSGSFLRDQVPPLELYAEAVEIIIIGVGDLPSAYLGYLFDDGQTQPAAVCRGAAAEETSEELLDGKRFGRTSVEDHQLAIQGPDYDISLGAVMADGVKHQVVDKDFGKDRVGFYFKLFGQLHINGDPFLAGLLGKEVQMLFYMLINRDAGFFQIDLMLYFGEQQQIFVEPVEFCDIPTQGAQHPSLVLVEPHLEKGVDLVLEQREGRLELMCGVFHKLALAFVDGRIFFDQRLKASVQAFKFIDSRLDKVRGLAFVDLKLMDLVQGIVKGLPSFGCRFLGQPDYADKKHQKDKGEHASYGEHHPFHFQQVDLFGVGVFSAGNFHWGVNDAERLFFLSRGVFDHGADYGIFFYAHIGHNGEMQVVPVPGLDVFGSEIAAGLVNECIFMLHEHLFGFVDKKPLAHKVEYRSADCENYGSEDKKIARGFAEQFFGIHFSHLYPSP